MIQRQLEHDLGAAHQPDSRPARAKVRDPSLQRNEGVGFEEREKCLHSGAALDHQERSWWWRIGGPNSRHRRDDDLNALHGLLGQFEAVSACGRTSYESAASLGGAGWAPTAVISTIWSAAFQNTAQSLPGKSRGL